MTKNIAVKLLMTDCLFNHILANSLLFSFGKKVITDEKKTCKK